METNDSAFETATWKLIQWHIDPGHGWLRVPLELLADDELRQSISGYSYMDSEFAYLEEDCDADRFEHHWANHLDVDAARLPGKPEDGWPSVRGDYADGHVDRGFKNPRYLDGFNYDVAQRRIRGK
jgi:hypothetical protein